MDHLRAATFLIADGAVPSNKDQGYFTRRLIRRAVRHVQKLGVEQNIVGEIVASFVESYAHESAYPELSEKRDMIIAEAEKEEQKFKRTLEKGLKEFEKYEKVTGKDAFVLFSTYGFPLELTEELAEEKGLEIDKEEFKKEFKKHQDLSRQASAGKFKGGLADHSEMSVKYHTATHLLHRALKNVLGDHVQQRGSNITPERLRFDFSHPEKMTDEQKKAVEDEVNNAIQEDLPVSWSEMTVTEAKEKGAIGLFEDKYGDKVKVYEMGEYSKEICGGPHVEHTATLGTFKIKKEESASAGVRRIKAVLQ
jgi:alanyl-tRNA synthetase